jgi:hypothetical protein
MSVDRRFEEEAGRAMNYQVLGHQLEVQGLCPLCQGFAKSKNHSQHHPREGQGR